MPSTKMQIQLISDVLLWLAGKSLEFPVSLTGFGFAVRILISDLYTAMNLNNQECG